jgi:3-oxoacyl-[acyl-carrier protein] reductase
MSERKVAVVTAAAGVGIGAAVARRLAADGLDVVVTDSHERRAHEAAARLGEEVGRDVLALTLDVTDFDSAGAVMQQVVDQRGRLDVLVNNAGWSKIEPVAEMDPDTWRRCIEVDLNGTFYCLRQALPHMIKLGNGGSVVNVSSIAAWETTDEHGAAYSAAKAGVLALTRVAAAEVGGQGIRVNAVVPGLIYNEFLRRIYPDEFFAGYAERRSRVGRIGQPEDVAALVSFLAGDEAGYITGEAYGISGGVFPHG